MRKLEINLKELYEKFPKVLDLLLYDNSSKKNIIWATDSYKRKGYFFDKEIFAYSIVKSNLIMPRSQKTKAEQSKRSKDNAEVFTPSWICNKQNNLIDNSWFAKIGIFNLEDGEKWYPNPEKITFPTDRQWIDYIGDIRLEVACGEAPYIVSRYDTVTGEYLELNHRIGILDRKFRVVNENCDSKDDWVKNSLIAIKSVYGYEWQGDNLFLARENVFLSYVEYYYNKFNVIPDMPLLIEVATIISWNFWQMDGIKFVIPNSCKSNRVVQLDLFGEEHIIENGCIGCAKGNIHQHNGVYSKIMDWGSNKKIKFVDLIKGERSL